MFSEDKLNEAIKSIVSKLSTEIEGIKVEQKVAETVEKVNNSMVGNIVSKSTFVEVDDAVGKARIAFEKLRKISLEKRKAIIANIRKKALEHIEEFSKMAVEETGLGRVEDKKAKNILAITKTPGVEDLESAVITGDHGMTLIEMAPWGVIASITPSTNPTETVINNAISMIAAGNAIVFHPHPSAKNVTNYAIKLVDEAVREVSGIANLVTTVTNPTIESANYLMTHKGIDLLVVTGGPGVVNAAMKSGKKVIAAGPGNPPVVVDETADIKKAASDIVKGSSLDNNIICVDEKEVIAIDKIADSLKKFMLEAGAYEISGEKIDELAKLVLTDKGYPNKKWVGKDANLILEAIGIKPSFDARVIICEVPKNHLFVLEELLMPVLPIVRVKDFDEALEVALMAEGGRKHSGVMHSMNIARLHEMAVALDTAIFTKNAPSTAGLGFGGEGPTTFTIGTTTGDGITTAKTFTRKRNCVLVDYFRIV